MRCHESHLSRRRRGTAARLALLAVALGVLWRTVRYALGFPLWGDEAFVAMTLVLRDSFASLFRPLEYGQVVPFGVMCAEMAATRLLGLGEHALRLVPFLAGVASLLLFYRLAFRLLPRWPAMLATTILAASYYPGRHGVEVKPYSTDLLIAIVLLSLAWSVFERSGSAARWLVLTAAATAAIWCSYPAAFVAGGIGLLLTLVLARERTAGVAAGWAVYGTFVAAGFLAMIVLYANPHASAGWVPGAAATESVFGEGFPPIRQPWRLPAWLVMIHTGLLLSYPVGGTHGGSTATFLLVLMGVGVLWRRNRPLLLLFTGPLIFTFLAAAARRYPYGPSARFSQHMAPTLCLFAGLGLSWAIGRLTPKARAPAVMRVAACVFMLFPLVGIVKDLIRPYKTFSDAENRRVLRWLASQSQPGDEWISFNAQGHKDGYADDLGLRGGNGARHRYYLYRFAPGPLRWAPPLDELRVPRSGRTWLIVYRDRRAPFPEASLEAYVAVLATGSTPAPPETFTLDPKAGESLEIRLFTPVGRKVVTGQKADP